MLFSSLLIFAFERLMTSPQIPAEITNITGDKSVKKDKSVITINKIKVAMSTTDFFASLIIELKIRATTAARIPANAH